MRVFYFFKRKRLRSLKISIFRDRKRPRNLPKDLQNCQLFSMMMMMMMTTTTRNLVSKPKPPTVALNTRYVLPTSNQQWLEQWFKLLERPFICYAVQFANGLHRFEGRIIHVRQSCKFLFINALYFEFWKEEQLNGKKKAKKRKRKGEGEPGAMDPLEYYEAVKLQKRKKKEAKEAAFRSVHLRLWNEKSKR